LATTQGAYDNFIIGTLIHIASNAELKQTFDWAKARGHWQKLPASFAPYAKDVMMATLKPGKWPPMTVFIMRSEYESAPLRVGDLVRYRSHDAAHDAPRNDPVVRQLFNGLTGCIATLCTKGDKTCLGGFQRGVFTLKGNQVNPATGKQLVNGIRIDTVSLRPLPTTTPPDTLTSHASPNISSTSAITRKTGSAGGRL
jgi:hypothetical protein